MKMFTGGKNELNWEICKKFKSPDILSVQKARRWESLGHAVRMDGERSERGN